MKTTNMKKLALAGILIAVGVACSPFYIPVGASKCFPIQHMVNVLAAVVLGPYYGVAMAFVTSLLRLAMGTGSILAFPGSMCGALLCGLVYHYTQKLPWTYVADVALFAYVIPFLVSTVGGTVIAAVLIAALKKTHVLEQFAA